MTVLEINGKRVEVDESFKSLPPDQQQSVVEEIAGSLGEGRAGGEFNMGTLNRGIAQGFGGAVDAVNAGLNAVYRRVGLPEVEQPFGGSQSLMRGMDAIGASVADEDATTTTGRMVQGVGQVAGALPTIMAPVGQLAKTADASRGFSLGNTAKLMSDDLAQRPVRTVSSELSAAAGAVYGGEKAAELLESDDPTIRATGQVLGGLTAGLGPYAATRGAVETAKRLPLTGTAIRGIRASIVPFTRSGGFERASNRLRSLSADPEGQAAAISTDSPLSPAQETGDKRLMALERAVLDTDARLSDEFETKLSEASQELRAALKEPFDGDIGDTRAFIDQRRDYLLQLLATRLEQARLTADQKTARVRPERRETVNATMLRRELDQSYDAASQQERQLWDAVPPMATAGTENLRTTFAEISETTSQAQAEDIPAIAARLLGKDGLPEETTVREIRGLYSKLRQVARNARAGSAPNNNLARIADMLADAALDDLGARATDATDVGKLINDARAFSRAVKEAFDQGTVGGLRGRLQTGGDTVPPELSLVSSVGRGGARGAVAYDDLLRASGNREAIDRVVEDYLRGKFQDQTTVAGRFSQSRAQSFQTQNRELLDRLPSLRSEIEEATRGQALADRVGHRTTSATRRLNDPRQSSSAVVSGARTGEEVAAIFRARSPAKAASEVVRQTRKDPTGQALAGLKGGFVDHLMQSARMGRFDDTGQPILSGRALLGQLSDPKSLQVLRRVFNNEELGRLRRISTQLRNVETAQGRLPSVGDPMNDTPNQMISFVSRIAAARQGARAGQGTGGGQLVIAGEFSKRIQRILGGLTNDTAEQLLKDAIQDKDIFKALLLRDGAPIRIQRRHERSLTEWAIATGVIAAQEGQND